MPDSLQEITSAVHQSTLRTVQAAWPTRVSGTALMDLTEASLTHLDQTLAGFTQIAGLKTACAAGCFFCCYLPIDVRAHEVFLILRWLDENWSPEAVGGLLENARRVRALAEQNPSHPAGTLLPGHPDAPPASPEDPPPATRQPCFFLRHGQCSIHSVRPGACRRYFSASLEACGDLYEGLEPSQGLQFPLLKESGRAAGTAINNTFIAKGYDGYSYQLPLAIASALEDPSCWERWLKKEKAFPASAESILPPGFSQSENLARLQAALRSSATDAPSGAAGAAAPSGADVPDGVDHIQAVGGDALAADAATAPVGNSVCVPVSDPSEMLSTITPTATSRTWNQSLSSTPPPVGNPVQKKPADPA